MAESNDALAASLGHDPLRIYNHVRQNFRFELYSALCKKTTSASGGWLGLGGWRRCGWGSGPGGGSSGGGAGGGVGSSSQGGIGDGDGGGAQCGKGVICADPVNLTHGNFMMSATDVTVNAPGLPVSFSLTPAKSEKGYHCSGCRQVK